jgi:flavin-dependent dehydrogenase
MTSPIEIVGGGLAGLSLGLALRHEDVDVTLFEAGTYPRHRVCGEFITGLGGRTIARLGLETFLSDALRHREIAWFCRDEAMRIQRLPDPALGISRHRLDARLAQAFVAAGGKLQTRHRVVDDRTRAGRVFASGRRRGGRTWLGLKVHVFDLPLMRDLEVHLGDDAYVGLSRVEDNRVNVCGLFRRRELCARGSNLLLGYMRAAGMEELAVRVESHERDESSFSAVAALDFDRQVETVGRVSLGDACVMIPPFTGNGMAMAFQSAEIALDPLVAFARGKLPWADAVGAIHRQLRRRFRVRLSSAHLLHPYLLRPRRQLWMSRLGRAHLLPFRPLYATLH